MTYRFEPVRPRVPSVPPTVHGQTAPGPVRSPDARVRLRAPGSRSASLASLLAVHNDGLVVRSPVSTGLAGDANEPVGLLRT
jgi:hypothetical protein